MIFFAYHYHNGNGYDDYGRDYGDPEYVDPVFRRIDAVARYSVSLLADEVLQLVISRVSACRRY
jgi:hypothetical protein